MSSISTANKSPLWLCLYFPRLPVEICARALPPAQTQRPLVVTERGHIVDANDAARALGLGPGKTFHTALATTDDLLNRERDEKQEQAVLHRLARWAYRFTPQVSVQPPDCLLLQVGNCLRLFKGLPALQALVQEDLSRLGHEPVMAVGRTPLAARLMARHGVPGDDRAPRDCIGKLPVDQLEVAPEILAGLRSMGIRRMDNLLALPASALSRRFGASFADYLARLVGDKPDPRRFVATAPHFFSEISFPADVGEIDSLVFPMQRLLIELEGFLEGRQLHITHLGWKLSHRSHAPCSFDVSLATPSSRAAVFLSLTRLKLDRVEMREIDSISLTARQFFPADPPAGDLFHGTPFRRRDGRVSSTADQARADELLNLLTNRLGPESCFGLSIVDDHRPEKAWQVTPPRDLGPSRQTADDSSSPRPLFLLGTPKPLKSAGDTPCLGGPLTLLKGPERIDSGWWDRENVLQPSARDYYIARQRGGSLFWVFLHPAGAPTARWYLHGIFS